MMMSEPVLNLLLLPMLGKMSRVSEEVSNFGRDFNLLLATFLGTEMLKSRRLVSREYLFRA